MQHTTLVIKATHTPQRHEACAALTLPPLTCRASSLRRPDSSEAGLMPVANLQPCVRHAARRHPAGRQGSVYVALVGSAVLFGHQC